MKQILILGTFLLVGMMLIAGIWFPSSPLMWLASSSTELHFARGLILVALLVVLLTKPPRRPAVRALLLGGSLVLVAFVGASIDRFILGLFDTLVFWQVALILAIEGLEANEKIMRFSHLRMPTLSR